MFLQSCPDIFVHVLLDLVQCKESRENTEKPVFERITFQNRAGHRTGAIGLTKCKLTGNG